MRFTLSTIYVYVCAKGRAGGRKEVSHQATIVQSLLSPTLLNHGPERLRINGLGCLAHRRCAFGQNLCLEVQLGEVKRHQQRGGLGLADLVGEEVRDGIGNLITGHLCMDGPELGQQWLDIDQGQILPAGIALWCGHCGCR
jgi:hypothetical protein